MSLSDGSINVLIRFNGLKKLKVGLKYKVLTCSKRYKIVLKNISIRGGKEGFMLCGVQGVRGFRVINITGIEI